MKKILTLLFALTFLTCQQPQKSNTSAAGVFEKITKEAFAKKIEEKADEIIVDVRTPEEFQNGTIKGAMNINFYDKNFEAQISKIDKSKPVLIFCQKGGRSGKALNKMKTLGFQEVYDLIGGYGGWEK